MKTVRFSQIVERNGRPRVHPLWIAPEKDPEFVRAKNAGRVMTIFSAGHGKTDGGIVGFDPRERENRQYLVFPRSLASFAGKRVVGIKYDLIDAIPTLTPATRKPTHRPRRQHARTLSRRAHLETHRESPTAPTVRRETAPTSPPKEEPRTIRRSAPPGRGRQSALAASDDLRGEVRRALTEMRRGETTAAYERLRRAIAS